MLVKMEEHLGWALLAGMSIYYLHNTPVPVEVIKVEDSPTNVNELDPQRWPDAEQPLAAIVPNADPIEDPVVQELYNSIRAA